MSNYYVTFSAEYLFSNAHSNGFPETLIFWHIKKSGKISKSQVKLLVWEARCDTMICVHTASLVDSRGIFSADFESAGGRKLSVEHFEKIQNGRHKPPIFLNVPKFNIATNQKSRFLVSTFKFWGSTSLMKWFL